MNRIRPQHAAVLVLALTVAASSAFAAAAKPAKTATSTSPAARKAAIKKRATARRDQTVLARVGSDVITLKDLDDQIAQYPDQVRGQYQSPEAKKSILDRMVQERVWLRAAAAAGFDKRPDIQQQIKQQTTSIVLRGYFNAAVVERSKPTPDEVEAYYKGHTTDYTTPETVGWRHILTKSEKDARAAKARVAKGEDFEKVAKAVSIDRVSKDAGGWLGYLTRGKMPADSNAAVQALVDAAFELPTGAVSDPIQTSRGWHVIKIDKHDTTSVRALEDVRQAIEYKIGNERSQSLYNRMLDSLKTAYKAVVLADSTTFASLATGAGATSAKELFDLAQTTQDPHARLALYGRVVKEYPTSDLAAQAQFMIGFVNSEELHDYAAAESAFKAMKTRYPKSDLVDDAEWMLKNMKNTDAPDVTEDKDKELASPTNGGGTREGGEAKKP